MRKKSILMAVLMMAAASLMSFVSASEEETIVIEGELANVPDSMYLNLLEDVGAQLSTLNGDMVLGGKFRIEDVSEDGGVNPGHLMNAKTGFITHHTLWIMPGARVKITGDGMDYSAGKSKAMCLPKRQKTNFGTMHTRN